MAGVKDAVIPMLGRLQPGTVAAVRRRIAGARVERVQQHQLLQRDAQLLGVRVNRGGQLAQDALHLARFRDLQLAQAVHQIDGDGRLDEERAAGRRLIVHDTADLAAPFPAHGYDVAALANGDRRILHLETSRQRRHVMLELLHDARARATQLAAHTREFTRCVVAHFAAIVNGLRDLLLQSVERNQRLRQLGQQRPVLRLPMHHRFDRLRSVQQHGQLVQLAAIQRRAGHGRLAQGGPHIRDARHRPLLAPDQ